MILTMVFCLGILTSSPGCKEVKRPLLRDITPHQCIMKAQEHIVTEAKQWEGYVFSRYSCWRKT